VLSDDLEFPTVTLPWIHRGVAVHFLPAPDGIVRAEAFAEDVAPEAATVAISHVQFSNGCRQDLDGFGRVKGRRRLVVSGSQSVGAFRVDVTRSGIDVLACAGHKWLCAGYGAGFCVIRRELLASRGPRQVGWMSGVDPYAFDNRRMRVLDTAARAEMGCPAFAGIFALGAAVDYLSAIGIERIEARVLALNEHLTMLLEDAGFLVLSPGGSHRSGETLVEVSDPQAACAFLASRGVVVTPKPQGLRVATHFYNDEKDVDACVAALRGWRESPAA
jgi:selenocysteine lyase/cysteine desulfurase